MEILVRSECPAKCQPTDFIFKFSPAEIDHKYFVYKIIKWTKSNNCKIKINNNILDFIPCPANI